MPSLFDPLTIGELQLPNRVIMAPLTRLRAGETKVPNDLMAEYYAQRASAGLIITEGVPVSPQGVGYRGVAGIWTEDHVNGWKGVTRAVKAAGGRIFMQIWHVGRISDPMFYDGKPPVGPSALAAKGNVSLLRPERSFVAPRPLETHEIAMGDSDLSATFGYVARELGRRRIAFLCVREHVAADSLGPKLRVAFGGIYIATEGFTATTAQSALDAGWADAVAFGKAFIANPDLVERMRADAPLNKPHPATFYAPGAGGYTDY